MAEPGLDLLAERRAAHEKLCLAQAEAALDLYHAEGRLDEARRAVHEAQEAAAAIQKQREIAFTFWLQTWVDQFLSRPEAPRG